MHQWSNSCQICLWRPGTPFHITIAELSVGNFQSYRLLHYDRRYLHMFQQCALLSDSCRVLSLTWCHYQSQWHVCAHLTRNFHTKQSLRSNKMYIYCSKYSWSLTCSCNWNQVLSPEEKRLSKAFWTLKPPFFLARPLSNGTPHVCWHQAACEEGEGSDTGNFEVLCMH